jgi:hypothetical protein
MRWHEEERKGKAFYKGTVDPLRGGGEEERLLRPFWGCGRCGFVLGISPWDYIS